MIIIWDIGAASVKDISKAAFPTADLADIGCAVFHGARAGANVLCAVTGRGPLAVLSAERIAEITVQMIVSKIAKKGVQIDVKQDERPEERPEMRMAIKTGVKPAATEATKMMMVIIGAAARGASKGGNGGKPGVLIGLIIPMVQERAAEAVIRRPIEMIRPPIINRRSAPVRRKIGKNRADRRVAEPILPKRVLPKRDHQKPVHQKPVLPEAGRRGLSKTATIGQTDLAIGLDSRAAPFHRMINPI